MASINVVGSLPHDVVAKVGGELLRIAAGAFDDDIVAVRHSGRRIPVYKNHTRQIGLVDGLFECGGRLCFTACVVGQFEPGILHDQHSFGLVQGISLGWRSTLVEIESAGTRRITAGRLNEISIVAGRKNEPVSRVRFGPLQHQRAMTNSERASLKHQLR